MNEIKFDFYIKYGGLGGVLNSQEYDLILSKFPPNWKDYLKKDKIRLNYYTNLGILELTFSNKKLISEHLEFDSDKLSSIDLYFIFDNYPIDQYTIEKISDISGNPIESIEEYDENWKIYSLEKFKVGLLGKTLSYIDVIYH